MKLLKTTVVAGLLAASGAASAIELSGNVALTTDYVWRGVSLSDNSPAVQGGFDADLGNGLYAGVWGSNVEAGDASLELDLYAGWATEVAGVGIDLGIIHYHFSGEPSINANEVYVGLSLGPVTLTQYVGLDTGVENTGDRDFGNYTDLGLELGEYAGVALAAHAGFYDVKEGGDDYYDWKLSASTSLIGADWELSYTDTDHVGDFGKADDDKVILTVSKSL